ncbi:hypothetical protein F511_38290 [Dorcoceras hygrometricum]|uniref:Uncharacterized protein n=1 Tax=Dorcoceras hygrometricum TaxID=472368 RepID=A0A2Z7AGI9_9LAMI|nr:hypothetical protein F511_38290 [Dorcoceras hygrometricum]
MEWAAGLAMETSRVDSVVRNQAEAKLNQLEHDEPAETTTTSCKRSFWTTRRKQQQHPIESLFVSAVAIYSVASYSVQSQEIQAQRIEEVSKRSSRGDKSAAKQLTNYQSWMSTAELNSNGESDKKPAKEKDTSTVPLSSVTQLRLFVHLWSLGVLTAAGCGIGSVHAVVRSNLLVEPSEVEEGEM